MISNPVSDVGMFNIKNEPPGATKQAVKQTAQDFDKTASAQTAVDETKLEKAVKTINDTLAQNNISRRFVIDEELKRTIVKLINEETKEVVKQFPSAEAIKISKSVDEMLGLLLDDKI